MPRYELIRLAQLVFALVVMFGAFLGGLAVGWWRWGRADAPSSAARPSGQGSAAQPGTGGFRPQPPRRAVSPDLFTPAEPVPEALEETPGAVGASFTPGPRELAPSVDPFQR